MCERHVPQLSSHNSHERCATSIRLELSSVFTLLISYVHTCTRGGNIGRGTLVCGKVHRCAICRLTSGTETLMCTCASNHTSYPVFSIASSSKADYIQHLALGVTFFAQHVLLAHVLVTNGKGGAHVARSAPIRQITHLARLMPTNLYHMYLFASLYFLLKTCTEVRNSL